LKKIGFIGAFQKTDLITHLAKILVELNKTVLVFDTTTNQYARYIVPTITPSKFYITQYEGVDIAVGFESLEDIKEYVGTEELKYDYLIMDIDSGEKFNILNIKEADKRYFVTGFDNYSLKKGLEILGKAEDKIEMTKVLFSRDMSHKENEYLNFLSFYYSVKWDKKTIYFPKELGDETVMSENQRSSRIKFKNLSMEFKEGLFELADELTEGNYKKEIKKMLKNI